MEFNIPASELLILVWALAKRNAGMALPAKPMVSKYRHLDQSIDLKTKKKSGKKVTAETASRTAANCNGLNASNPRLIKIYELPQIILKTMSKNMLNPYFLALESFIFIMSKNGGQFRTFFSITSNSTKFGHFSIRL